MIPYDILRTNHLFNGVGDNPLGIIPPRNYGSPGSNNGSNPILDRVLAQGDARFAHQQAIMDAAKQTADQRNYVESQRGRNVVMAPETINPLAGAKLQLQQQAEEGKNSRAAADLAEKQKVSDATISSREKLSTANLNEKQQYGQNALSVKQQMADIADFKAKNPNARVYAPKGGTVHLYDPVHGMVDTGIGTGTMSDADRLEAEKENQLAEIGARGDQSRQTVIQQGANAIEQIGARGAQNRATNAAKPVITKPQSENDKKTGYFNAAQKLANSDATLGKYIEFGSAPNTFSVKPGTPIEVQHRINEVIYGSGDSADTTKQQDAADVIKQDNTGNDDPAGLFK